jgi:BMFP domain-containing protein YqiC
MSRLFRCALLSALLFLSNVSHANPVLTTLGWIGAEALINSLVEETVQKFINPATTKKELQDLQQRIAGMETYLAQTPPADAPSPQEIARLQEKITQAAAVFTAAQGRLDSLEQRMKALEKHISALQTAAHAAPKTTTAQSAAKNDLPPLKISYVYRSGGRGEFKPFKNGDTLHSGDHVKIIFTVAEPVYIYIFGRDHSGKIQRLYPLQKFGKIALNHPNPVTAAVAHFVPAEQFSLVLDKTTGTETLYFVASRHQDRVLETFYNSLETLQKQHPQHQETLHAHQIFARQIMETKGYEPELAQEETTPIQWQEKGEDVDATLARLKNACDGCVQILKYRHE